MLVVIYILQIYFLKSQNVCFSYLTSRYQIIVFKPLLPSYLTKNRKYKFLCVILNFTFKNKAKIVSRNKKCNYHSSLLSNFYLITC